MAAQLDVDRATAKVAVLGAMYGQTTGHGAQALRRLDAVYPVGDALPPRRRRGRSGRAAHPHVRRPVDPLRSTNANDVTEREARRVGRWRMGRYGRNAMIQGAAAELFKRGPALRAGSPATVWPPRSSCACTTSSSSTPRSPRPTPSPASSPTASQEAATGWAPDDTVHFVADLSVVPRWSDAK